MLKLVVINEPYEIYDNEEVRNILGKIHALKIREYRDVFGRGSIPINSHDFFSSHFAVGIEENGEFKPLQAMRSISRKQCEKYGIEFPFVEHMFGGVKNELTADCEDFIRTHKNIGYASSYTIDTSLSKELRQKLAQMNMGTFYNYHQSIGVDSLIIGMCEARKVYRLGVNTGYKYFKDDVEYSTFMAPHIFDEKFRIMYLTEFSQMTIEMGEKYKKMWEQRIEFSKTSQEGEEDELLAA